MIHPDKCTGCRSCELACSMQQEGDFRPKASRIHVYTWEREGFSVPMMCQQCHDAPCIPVCMPKALPQRRDRPGRPRCGQMHRLQDVRPACPFGNASWDFLTSAILDATPATATRPASKSAPAGRWSGWLIPSRHKGASVPSRPNSRAHSWRPDDARLDRETAPGGPDHRKDRHRAAKSRMGARFHRRAWAWHQAHVRGGRSQGRCAVASEQADVRHRPADRHLRADGRAL